MKKYESETEHFLSTTFLQQKQVFIVDKYALEGNAALSHQEIWRPLISDTIAIKSHSQWKIYGVVFLHRIEELSC